ncbi:Mu transposase C-terminal domain-containing protein [Falsirhodobacter xinxiangensis]|uniref:Mu transposase C-terminal domain-containing protein n=1 Tax=Falsirhodobacter xinxiangensis TaxID=2530049 RepID=UPI001C70A5AE|nr:Mu transposase C-terminal domain-containing protein [Rhodobacter xinxiangensis]
MRKVFGVRLKRTVSKTGITVLGVRYHSRLLADWMLRNADKVVDVRWHPDDIGAIFFLMGGKWQKVSSVQQDMDGVRAQDWLVAVRRLRASFPAQSEFEQDMINQALKSIDDRVSDAKTTSNLLVEEWSAERAQREEARLFIGFKARGGERPVAPSPDGTSVEGRALSFEPAWPGIGSQEDQGASFDIPDSEVRDPAVIAPPADTVQSAEATIPASPRKTEAPANPAAAPAPKPKGGWTFDDE